MFTKLTNILKRILPVFLMAVFALSLVAMVGVEAQKKLELPDVCAGDCPVIGDSKNVNVNDKKGLVGIIIGAAQFLTYIGVGLSVLFMVWGGIRYITAGKQEDAGGAKQILINATIGLIVSIVAFTIVTLVASLLQGNTLGSFLNNGGRK